MNKFTAWLVSASIFCILVGCERSVHVNHGQIAYLLKAGLLQEFVVGPGDVTFSYPLRQLLLSDTSYEFEVLSANESFYVCLAIDSPKKFYENFNIGFTNVERVIRENIESNTDVPQGILAAKEVLSEYDAVNIEICRKSNSQ